MTAALQEYTLERTGQPPLKFRGRLLAESSGRWTVGRDNNRWHDLEIYRTEAGRYVVSIVFETIWQGETGTKTVVLLDTPTGVTDELLEYRNRIPDLLIGYPPGEAYEDKQQRLIQSLQMRFEDQITEVLKDDAFAERIE